MIPSFCTMAILIRKHMLLNKLSNFANNLKKFWYNWRLPIFFFLTRVLEIRFIYFNINTVSSSLDSSSSWSRINSKVPGVNTNSYKFTKSNLSISFKYITGNCFNNFLHQVWSNKHLKFIFIGDNVLLKLFCHLN